MTVNMASYLGKGLSPQQFIDSMTRNREAFTDWYRRFDWPSDDSKEFFHNLAERSTDLHCVVIAADWCGDVVRNVPVVFRLMETASIPAEVLILEEHLDLVDKHFLTMGGRSIPIVLFVQGDGEIVGRWGPRPSYVQEVMVEFKQNYPDKSAPDYEDNLKRARAELIRRYGEGTEYQPLVVSEIQTLLEGLLTPSK
ncbi:thioredoxin family protein [Alicyclobacillus acidiphilus]|uniref:thioredoxin family protein n=1 Tax=Alicyclobacillus acidiphilus TaxID=182455 RepID=UPI0008323ED5|nr:thioredoxin family protein [Alicyclobacillus acidiphilus]